MASRRAAAGASLLGLGSDLLMRILTNQQQDRTQARQFAFDREQKGIDREAANKQALTMKEMSEEDAARNAAANNPSIALRSKKAGLSKIGGVDISQFLPTEEETGKKIVDSITGAKRATDVPSLGAMGEEWEAGGHDPLAPTGPVGVGGMNPGGSMYLNIPQGRMGRIAGIAASRRAELAKQEQNSFLGDHPIVNETGDALSITDPTGQAHNTTLTGAQLGTQESDKKIASNTPGANAATRANAFASAAGQNDSDWTDPVFSKKMELALAQAGQTAAMGTASERQQAVQLSQIRDANRIASELEGKGASVKVGSMTAAGSPLGAKIVGVGNDMGLTDVRDIDKQYVNAASRWNDIYTKVTSGVQFRQEEKESYLNTFFANSEDAPLLRKQKSDARKMFELSVEMGLKHGGFEQGKVLGNAINRGLLTPADMNKFFILSPEVVDGMNSVVR